ncbi:MAG: bis(5'-nucleosyl)-tetraphosphatase (symmetrical) YqeK [Candidatus Eremiobacteraeota bacterium]|nr:bis(5'-nucleosyl)-tetraphosphatase (symmetrical) YqeK [Candidatus Eremiobacteraeota bacterium]
MTFTELARKVREHVGQEHRYAHSVRVARCADLLARVHGVDRRKARLAGMLHDLARLYSPQRLVAESESRGFSIGAAEREHPTLLHARLGAALAREQFGVEDPEVLSAIEKHTLGDESMSDLDCVVYLADSLEPHRKFAERAELWDRALRDLRGATKETMRLTAIHHAQKRTGVPASAS